MVFSLSRRLASVLLSSILESPLLSLKRDLPLFPFLYSSAALKALFAICCDILAPMGKGIFFCYIACSKHIGRILCSRVFRPTL